MLGGPAFRNRTTGESLFIKLTNAFRAPTMFALGDKKNDVE